MSTDRDVEFHDAEVAEFDPGWPLLPVITGTIIETRKVHPEIWRILLQTENDGQKRIYLDCTDRRYRSWVE